MERKGSSLGEVALSFLNSLPLKERKESQQEISRFVSWYGREKSITELTAPQIAGYAEWVTASVSDPARRLAPVKSLLIYARKKGLLKVNLAAHLKTKRSGSRVFTPSRVSPEEPVELTSEGYNRLEAEYHNLREERARLVAEVQRAAADKDFRENAPLEAARERLGQVESRLKELEFTLKSAAILEEKSGDKLKVMIGSTVVLRELASGREVCFTLVSPREADAAKGKISVVSPTGKALLEHSEGETVEVIAPAGKLCYRIEKIQP